MRRTTTQNIKPLPVLDDDAFEHVGDVLTAVSGFLEEVERFLPLHHQDRIVLLVEEAHDGFLVAPIGFVADHVEILYDLDVECREIAGACGAHLERTESLNTSPTFIGALADIVRSTVESRS